MNGIPVQAAMGWGGSRPAPQARARIRDVLPPLGAVMLLTLAHIVFGASQPMAALTLSAALTVTAVVTLAFAGPRHVTSGMVACALVIALFGVTGLAGPLDRAAAPLAVLFAAGSLWIIGFVASRRRSALDATWSGLIWGSIFYCMLVLVIDGNALMFATGGAGMAGAFETPSQASVLFGLFAVIGLGRVLHVIKQMDAEALARSQMIERLLRDGLGGILLLGLAITCLAIMGSRAGLLLALGVLVGHAWWDTLSIATREHRGIPVRLAAIVGPFIAAGLAAWGVSFGWLHDESIAKGVGLSDTLPNMQRIQAYMGAWMEKPAFGHGLGSAGVVGDKAMTLFNAKAMLAPGNAHNVFVTWLVETGIVGLVLLVLAIGAMHARIIAAFRSRKTPRTFLRLAMAAGMLMLLHGVTDSSLDLPSATWLYALVLGAACGVATGRRSEPSSGSTD